MARRAGAGKNRVMKATFRFAASLCLAACGLATAAPAQAQMYWRIDTGWSEPRSANFKDNDFFNSGNVLSGPGPIPEQGVLDRFDGSLILGGGVGYRFNGRLRGDVTIATRPFFTLNDTLSDAGLSVTYRAPVTSTTLMVNGYYDFIGGGVRPYIGLGIGVAQNKTERLFQDFGLGFVNRFSGAKTDNAAMALMAGVGIPYSGWILDLGYRFIDLGKFKTGTVAEFGITGGHTGRLSAHEVTLGIRF
jgi:opacity protein-like surface antigen